MGFYNPMFDCADRRKVEFVIDEAAMPIVSAKLEVSCVCPCTQRNYLLPFLGGGKECIYQDIDRRRACICACIGD